MAGELARAKWLASGLRRMQQVVTFAVLPVAGEFIEAGATPDVGANAPILLKQFLRDKGLAQYRSRAEQLHAGRGQAGRTLG